MFLGESSEYHVKAGPSLLRVRGHPNATFRAGDRVFLRIPYDACTVISDEHGYCAEYHHEEAGVMVSSRPSTIVSTSI